MELNCTYLLEAKFCLVYEKDTTTCEQSIQSACFLVKESACLSVKGLDTMPLEKD